MWQNCFMQEGTKKIKAVSASAAEEQFNLDFGSDYVIIATVESK
jgi:hypothetical protein